MKKKKLFLLAAVLACAVMAAAACGDRRLPTEQYIATFETNGGTAVASIEGSRVLSEPVTTKEGYTFVGWHLSEDLTDAPASFPFVLTKDTTFYAEWAEQDEPGPEPGQTFTVRFVANGGIAMDDLVTSSIAAEPVPERTGWIFKGWYLNADFSGARVTFPYTVTADVTLYAKWAPAAQTEYVVTFETNGGDPMASVTLPYEGTIDTEPVPTKHNGTFAGWFTNIDLSGERVTFPFEVLDDVTLYAKWTANESITPDEIEQLKGYLSKTTYTNYGLSYLWNIENTDGKTMYKAESYFSYADGGFASSSPYFDESTGEWEKDDQGKYVYYWDYAFRRSANEYMIYMEDPSGEYAYGGRFFLAQPATDPADYFNVTTLSAIAGFRAENFYKYEGKWVAKGEAADGYAQAVLGNNSDGNSEQYTSFALSFDAQGVLTAIDAVSRVTAYGQGPNGSTTVTYYDYSYTIGVNKIGEIVFPSETEFVGDKDRPSGLYPMLDENDANRNVPVDTTKTYTTEQLATALAAMTEFKSYYTSAGKTFSGLIYETSTLLNDGVQGKVDSGRITITQGSATQSADYAGRYYYYDEAHNAFFLAIPKTGGGYDVYCDQYSYKNNYLYNQYLLGIFGSGSAITYNCKLPNIGLTGLDATKFTFNAQEHYFEYADARTIKAAGQSLFGDMDLVYPEAGETESYTYLRIYMNTSGKIAKVLAATTVGLDDGGGTEFFMKELCITQYAEQTVTLPAGVEFIAPGEAKTDGTTEKLSAALTGMNGKTYTYKDEFVYDYDDELVGVFGNNGDNGAYDIYKHTPAATQVNNGFFYYYKDGEPYYCRTTDDPVRVYDLDDARDANTVIAWGIPLTQMLEADWFYEGRDGKYYAKETHLADVGAVIARYSGTEYFLGYPQVGVYTWNVVIKFCAVTLDGSNIQDIYYSGAVHVKGPSGSHDKPFSGRGVFTAIGSTGVTLPAAAAGADANPPAQVSRVLVPDYDFSVGGDGKLHLTPVPFASSYTADIYRKVTGGSYELVQNDIAVADGTDLKDAQYGLVTDETSTFVYYLEITAKGDGAKWLDARPSAKYEFSLSALDMLDAPTLTADRTQESVTVSPVTGANKGYHVEVTYGTKQTAHLSFDLQAGEYVIDVSDPVKYPAGRTYEFRVYAKGDNVNNRDGATASVRLTKESDEMSVERALQAVDGRQSFYADVSGTCVDSAGKFAYKYLTCVFYDEALNKGRVIYAKTTDENQSIGKYVFDDDKYKCAAFDESVEFTFSIQDGKAVGTKTIRAFGQEISRAPFTLDEIPFKALQQIGGWTETDGYLESNNTTEWKLTPADMPAARAHVQTALFCGFNGATFDVDEAVLSVGYTKNGDKIVVSESTFKLTASGRDDDGNLHTVSIKFGGYGKSQNGWVQ